MHWWRILGILSPRGRQHFDWHCRARSTYSLVGKAEARSWQEDGPNRDLCHWRLVSVLFFLFVDSLFTFKHLLTHTHTQCLTTHSVCIASILRMPFVGQLKCQDITCKYNKGSLRLTDEENSRIGSSNKSRTLTNTAKGPDHNKNPIVKESKEGKHKTWFGTQSKKDDERTRKGSMEE